MGDARRYAILIPVYDDAASLALLLPRLDAAMAEFPGADVVIVDDGSSEPIRHSLGGVAFENFASISVLELRRNLGHQRAIAIGLTWLYENAHHEAVVVMDGDGEDEPADVPKLLRCFEQQSTGQIVFAGRSRRSESWLFIISYNLYKLVHLLLTGNKVEVGNFSVVPRQALERLAVVSELWNHFAAATYKARLPRIIVPCPRGRRLAGRSSMNPSALVVHGLSAISIFGDIVGARLLIAAIVLVLVVVAGLIAVGVLGLTGATFSLAAVAAMGLLLIILLQAMVICLVFAFTILGARQGSAFLPLRDYRFYVAGVKNIEMRGAPMAAPAKAGR